MLNFLYNNLWTAQKIRLWKLKFTRPMAIFSKIHLPGQASKYLCRTLQSDNHKLSYRQMTIVKICRHKWVKSLLNIKTRISLKISFMPLLYAFTNKYVNTKYFNDRNFDFQYATLFLQKLTVSQKIDHFQLTEIL